METNFTSDAASRIESAEEPAAVPASKPDAPTASPKASEGELKPCPFGCTKRPAIDSSKLGFVVRCDSANYSHDVASFGDTEAEAIAAWNTRVAPAPDPNRLMKQSHLLSQLEELKGALRESATDKQRIAELEAQVRAKDARMLELAKLFKVCDGGRYLNDWIAKAEKFARAESELAQRDEKLQEWALQINAQSDKEVQLLSKIERLESELAIARDLIERHKQEEPVCESDFCHHSGLAHCNLGPDGRRGCCYCLCESYLPASPESMRKEKQA